MGRMAGIGVVRDERQHGVPVFIQGMLPAGLWCFGWQVEGIAQHARITCDLPVQLVAAPIIDQQETESQCRIKAGYDVGAAVQFADPE